MKYITTIIIVFLTFKISAQDSLIFVIRVDDIQSRNTSYVPRSLNAFQGAVEQRGGKVTWLVIPHRLVESQNTDGVLLKEIKQSIQRGHEAGVHGYNHVCPVDGNTGHEMYCPTTGTHLSYAQQTKLLDSSLALFRDSIKSTPVTFVSPGHYEDSVTYQALLDKGFRYISTTAPTKRYIYKNLFNLNRHAEYTWQLTSAGYRTSLSKALSDIRAAAVTDKYFCVLHHDPFIRQGYSNGIVVQWMGELLDSVNLQFNGKVKYMTIGQAAEYFRQQATSAKEGASAPVSFALEQNYPNPFNPSTVIRYSVPAQAGSRVSLKVYDVLGKEAAVLVNENQSAGTYEVSFDASPLPSGAYFYELRAGEYRAIKKMMLVQ